jgi:hypothetical protein
MVTSKLRVKLGRLELDFEGSEDFIKQELVTLLTQLKTLGALSASDPDADAEESGDTGGGARKKTQPSSDITTSTIAAKTGADSGPELAMAAAVRLTMIGGASKATRDEIVTEMRGASAYFKQTYVKNLTRTLKQLVTEQRLNDMGSNSYSIPAPERKKLEEKLARD